MAKRSRASSSKGEPIPKKATRESEAEASMPEVVPPGVGEHGEEEEEEEEVPVLRFQGLRNRGPVILEEGELTGEPVIDEEVERPEVDFVRKDDIEILGVSTQPGPSSAYGKKVEV